MARVTLKPEVLREFDAIGKYRLRLIRDSRGVWLDIREWVAGSNYEGFTRHGVRIAAADLPKLADAAARAMLAATPGQVVPVKREDAP